MSSSEFHIRRWVATVVVLAAIIGGVVLDVGSGIGEAAPYLAPQPCGDHGTRYQSRAAWQSVQWFCHRFETGIAGSREHQFLEGCEE